MILQEPNEALHTKCEPVTFKEGKRIGELLKKEYTQAVKDSKDMTVVGLAAPQIGIPKRVFLIFDMLFINPQIQKRLGDTYEIEEGCLSLPDTYHPKRFTSLIVQWTTSSGRRQGGYLRGRDNVIFQHEFDHLSGKLCNE